MTTAANDNWLPASIDPLLRLPAVLAATGLKRSSLYVMMKDGRFPTAVRLGPNSVAWRASAIKAFNDNLPDAA
nr:AlpA family transcriptional regulator [Bradyrhizobium sp. CCBAU 51627]